jgi:Mrp family chromosome partitioning ATPase
MGLFSDANLKANQAQGEDELSHEPASEAFGSTAQTECDFRIAPELENSLDLIWGRVRARRQFVPGTQGQALALTHWEPREGATTLALALAFRAAQIDATCSFCLADFDLFQAGLSFTAGLEAEPGVSNILLEQSIIEESLCNTALPNLSILPAGYPAVGRQVSQLYGRCRELCEVLAARFHYVVLDMPSLRLHPNFAAWASGLAQAVLVVRAGQARRPAIAKALGTLDIMRLDVAGLILNAREYHVPRWLYTRT